MKSLKFAAQTKLFKLKQVNTGGTGKKSAAWNQGNC